MKDWAKGGLIGFIVAFVGLWIILLIIGSDPNGWKCVYLSGADYCSFFEFASSMLHWGFILFFSWVGFFGGVIDVRIINKILSKKINSHLIPLKITSTITSTLVVVFAIIGMLVFPNWVEILIYAIIFFFFVVLLSWLVGKWKYG